MNKEEILEMLNNTVNVDYTYKLILEKVEKERSKHLEKHMKGPNYIKMPIWCFEILKTYSNYILMPSISMIDIGKTQPKFMGMLVCETQAIKEIEEIEVF